MAKRKSKLPMITEETVMTKIYLIRGHKVMLDRDLAVLYGVETKVLNQAVRRHNKRFPHDFMFQLTETELEILRSQFVTSSWGGMRYMPYAFTENGLAMLSSVLNSETAVSVNIQIMRVFTRTRQLLVAHKDILLKLEQLDGNAKQNTSEIKIIFQYLKKLMDLNPSQRVPIGFKKKTSS